MDIIIAGGGALGRVIYDFLSQKYNIIAFMDDAQAENGSFNGIPINNFEQIRKHDLSKVKFVLSVLNPEDRESVVNRVAEQGGDFLKYTDDSSFVSPSASLGNGCVLLPYSFVMNNAYVGNYVHIHFNSAVGHDVIVGDYCSFAPQCIVGGYVNIGKNVTLGMGAKILPKIKIGNFASVGAGAVVTKDVPEGATVVGNPAKIIKKASI